MHDTNKSLSCDIDLDETTDAEGLTTSQSTESPGTVKKNFNLLSLAGIGLVTGNVWPALGGSLLGSVSSGGSPGVIFEFLVASLCYFCIAAVLCELTSALPSSSGVLFWSSELGGKKHGRVLGYFAGWWNTFAWVFAEASMCSISANTCVQMYASTHPQYTAKPWHIFICYLLVTWSSCAVVCLANNAVPKINVAGLVLILVGALVSIVVCVTMVGARHDFASSRAVWSEWKADTAYPSGFVFVSGMLNGAFAMGTPDAATHLAEEIPMPKVNVPKAIAAQYILGFITGFAYLVAILYSINDYSALGDASFPIAAVYQQATGSAAGTTGLLVVLLLPVLVCTIGLYVTCGRTLWTFARTGVTPFSWKTGHISSTNHMPLHATLQCACIVTILGCVELGSSVAFNAFIGSFILHSTASYMAATVPYLLKRRNPGFRPGPFYMHGRLGWVVHAWACTYMLVWFIIYSFPTVLPTSAATMNYSSLIWGGLTLIGAVWWFMSVRHKSTRLF